VYGGFLPEDGHPLAAAVRVESLRSRIFRVEVGPWGLPIRKAFRIPEALRRSITRWDGVPLSGKGGIARFVEPTLEPVLLGDRDFPGLREKTGRTLRVGFLGTSQTYGSGAETISDTFVAGTHVRLAAALRDTVLEFYDFSIPGTTSGELTDRFMELWRISRPDLLVVNLSHNDSDAKVLTGNLRVLALEMKREGGEIVFVLEANTIERDGQHLSARHAAVRKLGDELGVPVWDLHGYLSGDGIYDSGVLWWDEVHLTSYGQRLTADWLADRLFPLLLTRLKSPLGPAHK
jgi:lysophospholipase L1-like esterase